MSTARYGKAGCGTQTAALYIGGVSPVTGKTENWNGTAWTELADLNTARYALSCCGANDTAALAFGGTPPVKDETEEWDGSSWTEVADLATGRIEMEGAGTSTLGLCIGAGGPAMANTEEWSYSASVETVAFD